MELYLLSGEYRRLKILEDYESFIWTERFADHGDFQIVISMQSPLRYRLLPGTYMENSESPQPMVITTRGVKEDSEGRKMITVTGKTLTFDILEGRTVVPETGKENWTTKKVTSRVLSQLVIDHCVTPRFGSANDAYPNLSVTVRHDTTEEIEAAIPPKDLYPAYKEINDAAELGFAVELGRELGDLRYIIYKGVERKNVAFSEMLDNLSNVSHYDSLEEYRNVAYVWCKDNKHRLEVFAPGTSSSVSGFKRKVITVAASDIDPEKLTESQRNSMMRTRGLSELSKTRKIDLYDATVSSTELYEYRKHYWLGDIVRFLDDAGDVTKKRITEYIWAEDSEGLRSYPTFASID